MPIAIDDFGTGYSSMARLKTVPADVIKIDGSFVRGIARSREDTAIVKACLALADALDLKVVAECIETADQLADSTRRTPKGTKVTSAEPRSTDRSTE